MPAESVAGQVYWLSVDCVTDDGQLSGEFSDDNGDHAFIATPKRAASKWTKLSAASFKAARRVEEGNLRRAHRQGKGKSMRRAAGEADEVPVNQGLTVSLRGTRFGQK